MRPPEKICGIAVEDLADWSEPELRDGVLVRFARPSRWWYILDQRVPRKLRAAGIGVERAGGRLTLVQTLDAPPPVRRDAPVRVTVDASGMTVNEAGLLAWQPAAVRTLKMFWSRGQRGLADLSDTGVGKTYVALALARELRRSVKVVTKKAARTQWLEAAAALGVPCEAWNYEALKTGRHPWVKWKLHRAADGTAAEWPEWRLHPARDLLVFDEAQVCKAIDHTLNSKLLLTAAWRGVPLHLLSATLATSPVFLRAAGYALGLHDNQDFFPWLTRHGCIRIGDTWMFNNDRDIMRALHENLFNRCAVRLRRDECPGFPESLDEAVLMDFPPEAARAWAECADLLDRVQARVSGYAEDAFAQVMGARQLCEAAKVRTVVDLAREAEAEGFCTALFFNFDEPLRVAAKLLDCPTIVGGQKESERNAIQKLFQADRLPFLCVNSESGGTALSLHGRKPRRGIIMPTWKADTLRQVLGRLPRAGGAYCHQTIPFAAGTIEEEICHNIRTKLRNLDTLNDGDTQGPFALVRLAPRKKTTR